MTTTERTARGPWLVGVILGTSNFVLSPSLIGTSRSSIERGLRKEPARMFLVHDSTSHVPFDCYMQPRTTTEIRSCALVSKIINFESNPWGLHNHSRRLPRSSRSSSSSMMEDEWQETSFADRWREDVVIPETFQECSCHRSLQEWRSTRHSSFAGAGCNHKSQLKNDVRPKSEKKNRNDGWKRISVRE